MNTFFVKILGLGLPALVVMSAAASTEQQVTMSGTLIEPPPCTINNDNPMVVDFGPSVGLNKVDGSNYKKKIIFSIIKCGPSATNIEWDLYMELNGEGVDYNSGSLKTNVSDLAIQILHDNKPFELGKTTFVASKGLVVLEAVPVKKTGVTLKAGAFNAIATLQVSVQ